MNYFEKIGDTVLIELPEEVDDYRASILVGETEEVFSDIRIRYVIFDLLHTNMMDSSGIGLITRRFRNVYDRGGKVFIIHANERMQRILKMSGIFQIAERAESFETAYKRVHMS